MVIKNKIKSIAIIGDGGWGTTLAICLAKKKCAVSIWSPFREYAMTLEKTRYNAKFLPGIRIPRSIKVSSSLTNVICDSDLIVLAIPSRYIPSVVKKLKKFDFSKKIMLSVVKGIEPSNLLRVSQIIEKELGKMPLAILSGPTIATEVAHGIPSTAVISSKRPQVARMLQQVFNSKTFRIYVNSDVIGTELGGSIKNIIAIACGLCDGLGFGTNTKAAILTRGLAEMARLGKAMGAKPKTFSGLSGLGDLVTTCFSQKSRNRFVGEQLGKGKTIKQITSKMTMVAEGITTAKAIYLLSKKYKAPMPITTEIFRIIYKNKKPISAVADLMNRSLKNE